MDNPFTPVSSSLIVAYSYDADTHELIVNFKSDPNTDHVYSNVTPDVMSSVFDSSRSVGKAFRKLIANNKQFRHRKDV